MVFAGLGTYVLLMVLGIVSAVLTEARLVDPNKLYDRWQQRQPALLAGRLRSHRTSDYLESDFAGRFFSPSPADLTPELITTFAAGLGGGLLTRGSSRFGVRSFVVM
jgi:hypothetical protein